jgi:hypothetical protein
MPQLDTLHLPNHRSQLSDSLPADLRELIELSPLQGLDDSPRCTATFKRVQQVLTASPHLRGTATEAGLWLLAGDLDRSHQVSQSLETMDGSYWHGIMHRREGDFWNAKYWFRRAAKHPVFEQLAADLKNRFDPSHASSLPLGELTRAATMPGSLVDGCELALRQKSPNMSILEQICWLEWQFLFLHGWEN